MDEHAYKPLYWAVENFDSFGKYQREPWELYIGEFATNAGVGSGNLLAALNDSAYMMSMEKNSDLVKMGSYAPLLENVNKRDWPVNLIHFDSNRVFGRASYYACKLFAENRPSVNVATRVQYDSTIPKSISGRIGLGTWNTAAEFKDIRVEENGKLLYESDFSKEAAGWMPERGRGVAGTWVVENGVYRQKDPAVAWSYFGNDNWKNITVSLKARRISGAEGFLVCAGFADGRRVQFNVGGWGNRQHAVQVADAIVDEPVRESVEEGRWYDVKIEVRDRLLRCSLDGRLIKQIRLPRVDTVLAIAGKDDGTGDVVVKVVNSGPELASMSLRIEGEARIAPEAKLTVLTSANPKDENSFEVPSKIVPVTRVITGMSPGAALDFPPYSLSVIRFKTR